MFYGGFTGKTGNYHRAPNPIKSDRRMYHIVKFFNLKQMTPIKISKISLLSQVKNMKKCTSKTQQGQGKNKYKTLMHHGGSVHTYSLSKSVLGGMTTVSDTAQKQGQQ